jgi:hypothetical protein
MSSMSLSYLNSRWLGLGSSRRGVRPCASVQAAPKARVELQAANQQRSAGAIRSRRARGRSLPRGARGGARAPPARSSAAPGRTGRGRAAGALRIPSYYIFYLYDTHASTTLTVSASSRAPSVSPARRIHEQGRIQRKQMRGLGRLRSTEARGCSEDLAPWLLSLS